MARKPPRNKPAPKPEPDPMMVQDVVNLKRDLSGALRDIGDCRRDVEDCRHEVKEAVSKRRGWAIFAISVVGFLGITSLGGVLYIQKQILDAAKDRLTKQVEDLYKERNVARVVDQVIRNDANNLIHKKVDAEVDPIVQGLRNTQQEQSQVLANFQKDQEKYATITLLHDLIIKAESGDVAAFRKLAKTTTLPDPVLSKTAEQSMQKVWDMYFNQSHVITRQFNDSVPDSQVATYLGSENYIDRKLAVYTVRKRKTYDRVPELIDRIAPETNLDVLAAIEATLNTLLDVRFQILLEDNVQSKYRETWNLKKDQLLGHKTAMP